MSAGWIKLHRQLLEWEWYDDMNVKVVFLHCLLKANHRDKNWRGVLVKRGSFLTGREKLAEEVGLTVRQTRTALTKLESTSDIAIKATNHGSVVTIVKYGDFQDVEQKATSRTTSNESQQRPASDQQATTTKNDKNIRIKEGESIGTHAQAALSSFNSSIPVGGEPLPSYDPHTLIKLINSLRPEWGKPATWTYQDMQILHQGVGQQMNELTEADWNNVRMYLSSSISGAKGFWKPKSRKQFCEHFSDVLGHVSRWLEKQGRTPAHHTSASAHSDDINF